MDQQQNFYDQLASDDFVVSAAQLQNELKQIKTGLDKDLMSNNLQDSSGLVNQLGLQEASSMYQQKGRIGGQAGAIPGSAVAPNFGRREQVQLGEEDFNIVQPSARNPRESADLTIDMLIGKGNLAARRQPSDDIQSQIPNMIAERSNMPRNYNQAPLVAGAQQQTPSGTVNIDDGFSIEQFRKNNEQLQQIMMQLKTPQVQADTNNYQSQAQAQPQYMMHQQQPQLIVNNVGSQQRQRDHSTEDKFKQLSSAPTGQSGLTGSNPSSKQTYNVQRVVSDVSQFSYATANANAREEELPATSQYAPPSSGQMELQQVLARQQKAASSQQDHSKVEILNQAISQQQNFNGPQRSTSPIGLTQAQQQQHNQAQAHQQPASNYRQVFKPQNNSAFQNAAHSMMDNNNENYNMHNNLNQVGPPRIQSHQQNHQQHQQDGRNGLQNHVSQVELLSQLQQSNNNLQQSSSMQHLQYASNQGRQMQQQYDYQQHQSQLSQKPLSQQVSQPSLSGEFTLQPRQPGAPANNGSSATLSQLSQMQQQHPSLNANPENQGANMKSQQNQQISHQQPNATQVHEQHKRIMQQFDDIPINQIKKMPGYQTGLEMQDDESDPFNQGGAQAGPSGFGGNAGHMEDDDAVSRPLEERALNAKWNIRLAAYKEIKNMFQNDFAQFEGSKANEETPNGNPEHMASFDQYGPLLDKMIKDTNITASLEGLQVMHTYVRLALDIKAVTFASHNYLLEKAPTQKANFREICNKILLVSLEKDQATFLFPELVKRMKSNSQKIASFAMFVINEAFKTETALDEINLKNVFRMIQENLSQKDKGLRDLAMQILYHVYRCCGDDIGTFVANCKNLRPVQTKEIKESLSELEKSLRPAHQAKLFEAGQISEDTGGDTSARAKGTKETGAATRNGNASAFEQPQRDANLAQGTIAEPTDLLTLIPDNFQEIPYLAQINVKRKSMESFNTELAKLVAQGGNKPGSVPIRNRDYTLIYNTVAHMLEDKNFLVFAEAIKTVELLAILIGPLNYLKQAKVKQWVGLLAGKYGETKTAVIAAVDRAMLAIVNNAYNQVQFTQECINQIASTHKNPRVKQFVVEHTIIPFVQSISTQKDLVGNIFRTIKEKLVQMILKDNSASCRDASVTLLITFRQIVPDNSLVQQAITALPKYRISEIQKRLEEANPTQSEPEALEQPIRRNQTVVVQKKNPIAQGQQLDANNQDNEETDNSGQQQKPKFAKSLTDRIKSQKQQDQNQQDSNNSNNQKSIQIAFANEILKGKFITNETKMPLTEILYDLGTMQANKFEELYDSHTLEQKWDTCIRQIGELGIRECKPVLVNAIFTVVTTPRIVLFENQQCLKSMLNLLKRLFVLERSIERQEDGKSTELEQYLKICLLQNVWIANNQGETCQMLQVAMIATNNVFEFTEHLRDVVEQPMIIQCPASLQIIEAVYVWLGIRLNDFLAAGMELSDLEMLRGFGIRFLDGAGFSEPQRQALISIMIKFKDLVSFKRDEMDRSQATPRQNDQIDQELPSVSQLSRQHTPQIVTDEPTESERHLQSSQITHPQTAAFAMDSLMQESVSGSQKEATPRLNEELTADNICRLIDTEFEKGLLLFKDMAQQQTLDFEVKEQIFAKLLTVVTVREKSNPQQQYKQAYALKALMWMKEETLGIEDCFRLTQKVMGIYAQSEVDELDPSVELYLLNFWSKDLSIRDLTDRIGLCVLNSSGSNSDTAYQTGYSVSLTAQNCSPNQLAIFNSLLKWFSDKRLFNETQDEEEKEAEQDDEWLVTDLRKIVLYLTLSTLDNKVASAHISKDFLRKCVGKFGCEKVKEFMEIQLLHHNELSLKLLDWLENEFENKITVQSQSATHQSEENEKRVKLPNMPKVNLEEIKSRARADSRDQARLNSGDGDSSSAKPQTQQSNGSRTTPRGLIGASQSYKERRDLYKMKSSGKVRESSAGGPNQNQQSTNFGEEASAAQGAINYSEIINRIEQNIVGGGAGQNAQTGASKQIIDEASGESEEKDQEKKYSVYDDRLNEMENRKDRACPIEEQSLSRDERANFDEEDNGAGAEQPFRRTNTSAYYRSIEKKRKRYTPSAEELADDQDIKGVSDDSDEDQARIEDKRHHNTGGAKTQIATDDHHLRQQSRDEQDDKESKKYQMHQIEDQLELSAMKGRHINDKIQMLELDKERIEHQSDLLRQQKDEESAEWRSKVSQMTQEHTKVMSNLANVNEQYSQQVQENGQLKSQLEVMQMQHSEMMNRFEQIEKKMEDDRHKALSPQGRMPTSVMRESTAKKDMVVSVGKIQRIEDTFGQAMVTDGSEDEINQMIHRIQGLLLNVEKNVDGELAKPLIIHYTKLKQIDQRLQMLNALDQALEQNQDVLAALSAPVYKALLNYLLWAFAHEKQILEQTNISSQNINSSQADQNQVTMLSQQQVSKLLNSKRFTTSLVCLFQLLREAMPTDIAAELSIEERQYLRVVMRCIQRISRALHSEQPDMVRAFDVLLEMQKMFQTHPPELLREDLPCLADFDFIYRAMKDVSDKLIELQPEKVESFLSYATGSQGEPQNAFIKYLLQMMGSAD